MISMILLNSLLLLYEVDKSIKFITNKDRVKMSTLNCIMHSPALQNKKNAKY